MSGIAIHSKVASITAMSVLNAARSRSGVLAPAQFAFLKLVDRRLWYALHALGFEFGRPYRSSASEPEGRGDRRARPLGGRARGRRAHPDAGIRRGDRRHSAEDGREGGRNLARFSFAPCARTLWPKSAPTLPFVNEVTRC